VDQAARLNRMVRITTAVDGDSGLADLVLARVRLPRVGRWRLPLRVALAVVALAQLSLGLVSLIGPLGMSPAMPDSAHMNHEEAAFNIAFGIALLTIVWNGRRAAGQIPVLTAFVLVLAVSSIFDLLDGEVTWSRLATHLPVVLGLVLSVAIGRLAPTQPGPRAETRPPGRAEPRRASAALRAIAPFLPRHDRHAPPPAARRDVA
jgi:predicted anti-sigma-YlaC factor YlaD